MEKIIAAAILVASFTTSAQADIGKVLDTLNSIGSLSGDVQVGVAVDSTNVAAGENAVAVQGANIDCSDGGASDGRNIRGNVAVAVDSTNVAVGDSATAIQGSNIKGNVKDCFSD